MYCLTFSAPNTPPHNVSLSILDSFAIELAWLPPSLEDRNGIIRHYWIELYETNSTDVSFSLLREVLEESFPAVIQNLHPFYLYQLRVSTVTVEPGPFSDFIAWKMPEDGKNVYTVHLSLGTIL